MTGNVGRGALSLLLLLWTIMAPSAARAQDEPLQTMQGLGEVHYHHLESRLLGRGFHLWVRLPADHASDPEALPVVYLLDGGSVFPLAAGQYHYLSLGDELPPMILVGISYGSVFHREGNMRQTDYTAPAGERDFWGGAAQFLTMLKDELLPFIEGHYRTDPDRRILFGHSLGGQFVLYAALTEPQLFWGYIASSPALQLNLEFFMQSHGSVPEGGARPRLFVSSAERDPPDLRKATLDWMRQWNATPTRPWLLESRSLPGQTHYSVVADAFTQGLEWLFPKSP